MKKKIIIIGIGCILLLIAGICYSYSYQKSSDDFAVTLKDVQGDQTAIQTDSNDTEEKQQEIRISEVSNTEQRADRIFVHICGAVIHPGVYQMDSAVRLVDVIALAGGLLPEAAGDYINQAQKVSDGQRIYIPAMEEIQDISISEYIKGDEPVIENPEEGAKVPVNINHADAAQLMTIPGIGQAKANSIIEYRSTNGTFKTIEEIMNIPGIKDGLFQKISSYITV